MEISQVSGGYRPTPRVNRAEMAEAQSRHSTQPAVQEGFLEEEKDKKGSNRRGSLDGEECGSRVEREPRISFLFFSFFNIYLSGFTRSQLGHVGSSSLTRDQTQVPALGSGSLSHWITREVPGAWNS